METIVAPDVFEAFGLVSDHFMVQPIGKGHIHKSYLLQPLSGNFSPAFVLQNINTSIFKQPELIAENWLKISRYLQKNHPEYFLLSFIPTKDGAHFASANTSIKKAFWRLLPYIKGTVFEKVSSPDLAYKASRAFARFGAMLKDCDTQQIACVIPAFHDAGLRFQQFHQAVSRTSADRKKACAHLISKVLDYEWVVNKAEELCTKLPTRLQHMDAKAGNLVFPEEEKAQAVLLDLDTIMPSNILSDAGDMIRSMVCLAGEDETEAEQVIFEPSLFDAVKNGFFDAYGSNLSAFERMQFSFSGQLMLHMQAVRFLTDFLEGNRYYPVDYETHNLVRAANQLSLLEQLVAYNR